MYLRSDTASPWNYTGSMHSEEEEEKKNKKKKKL